MSNEYSVVNDEYTYVFVLNMVRTTIQNQWILDKTKQVKNAEFIKEKLLELINDEYESQRTAKKASVERVICGQGDLMWLINEALKLPFSSGSTYMAQFIHCNALFKACVEYEKTKLNEEKINTMMSTIDEKLSSPEFMKNFKNENPDIIKTIEDIHLSKTKIDTHEKQIILKKPRYVVWGIITTLFTGTSIGLYFYLKKN